LNSHIFAFDARSITTIVVADAGDRRAARWLLHRRLTEDLGVQRVDRIGPIGDLGTRVSEHDAGDRKERTGLSYI